MEEQAPEESEGGSRPRRPRVIYVMGAGRSGSTVLGVTLGNCEGVFYAGELDAWLSRSGEPLLDGEVRRSFWGAVRDRVEGAEALYGNEAQRSIERSLAAVRVHKWPARRRLRRPYRAVAERLYEAIGQVADTDVIVDTSHYPLRARELQALDGIDLHLLYLVRDPQSVVASFNRSDVAQYKKATLTTNVYLYLTNLLAVLVFLRQPRERRVFVSYERFIADPQAVLGDVLRGVGGASLPRDLAALRTGIPFQGNRIIRSESIALRGEESVPGRGSRLTAMLQLPWRAIQGRLRPAAGQG